MSLAVVTGASSGIGRATALALGELGFHVVCASRGHHRSHAVIEAIHSQGGSAEYLELDLGSLHHAREAAARFEASGRKIDVLVNNAGVGAQRGLTTDGFERHFGVNHLGHFMWTHHLRRTFRPGTRIIQVSSDVHRRADGIDFEAVTRRTRSLFGIQEYAVSKLANVLFAREMARLQPDWRLYAVHPGLTNTNILPSWVKPLARGRLLTPEEGADTVIWCATADELSGESGRYYARRDSLAPSPAALDDGLARELWKRSERWCDVAPQHGPG